MIAQLEVPRGFLVKALEPDAQCVYLDATGFRNVQKEILEHANGRVAGTGNLEGVVHKCMCVQKNKIRTVCASRTPCRTGVKK